MENSQASLSKRRTFFLLLVSILAVYAITFAQKYWDYSTFWLGHGEDYVVEDVTLLSNLDGYYWLKMARELDKGTLEKGQLEPTKGYPDLQMLAIQDKPGLLAEFISFANKFTGGDYYRAAIFLVPILAGLFVLPLFFYFNRVGFGASAIYGGLIATFGHAYYDRTMMGRVDTDLLNIFFPLLAACFILPIRKEKDWRYNTCLSIGAGLTMYLFTWWYQQPSFILIYLFVMILHLVFGRVPWKQVALILVVFLLASGPGHLTQVAGSMQTFIKAYVAPPHAGLIAWPNILNTVAEAQKYDIVTKLKTLHGFLPLVLAGFLGLFFLCIRHFRGMIPLSPLILIGLWSLVGPSRFVIYLAPLVGVGAGVLIELFIRYGAKKNWLKEANVPVLSIILMFVLFFSSSTYTGFYTHAGTPVSSAMARSLLDIKRIVPKNSAMFTPYWEYGYPLMAIGDFATYHDGSLQGGMRTTLSSKALISDQQSEMVSLLSYLEDHGFKGLGKTIRSENLSPDQMMKLVFDYQEDFKGENVYVLYLEPMAWKLPAMSKFGTWDFEKRKSEPMDYVELHCFSIVDNIMRCSDGTIDLNRGYMNDGTVDVPLKGAFFINDGYVVSRTDYDHEDGYYLQVLMKKNKTVRILVADERLFRTNFNQQYFLGYYDKRYFAEVYNDFPNARLLKVKRGGIKESPR